jgi:hypothetical protein
LELPCQVKKLFRQTIPAISMGYIIAAKRKRDIPAKDIPAFCSPPAIEKVAGGEELG